MERYIEVSALHSAIDDEIFMNESTKAAFRHIARRVPADSVENITRCRECSSCIDIDGIPYCTEWGKNTDENGYCHKGG